MRDLRVYRMVGEKAKGKGTTSEVQETWVQIQTLRSMNLLVVPLGKLFNLP